MAAVFQSIVDAVSGSAWTYGIVFGVAALDAFFPIVPSEATVITAAVLSAQEGGLRVELIIPAAAIGAIIGDNVSYWAGRLFGERIAEKLFSGERRRHLDRAHRLVEERGGYLIIVGRFIPGGRTAVTFAAGSLHWPWKRFIVFDILAGLIWATYASLLGYVGGATFEHSTWKGLLLAFAGAALVTGAIETVRWFRKRALRTE
jgi:membrane protein DedA with SNARE-associated domain